MAEQTPKGMACDACQKPFPPDYRFCPHCARTLRERNDTLEEHLGMGLPGRFNWRIIAGVALILLLLAALGVWRLSRIPAEPPPTPAPRPAQTTVERRFMADLAKLGYDVQFKGSSLVVVRVDEQRWEALEQQGRFAKHALVGDFRRALAAHQRDQNDPTDYRIRVRGKNTDALLAEETDFNLKVYR